MARIKDREKALSLRKEGMSYSQIKKTLGISKSTLSGWLKDYPLSKERIRELRDCNEQRIERYRETMRAKREKVLKEIYDKQKKIILPLTKRDLFMFGLGLYWGEGSKRIDGSIVISNTNPAVIKFFINWVEKTLKISRDRLSIQLQLYSDMNITEEVNFWSGELKIPLLQFIRPYIKKNTGARINHKGSFGHGTCNAKLSSVTLWNEIMMSLKVVSDKYK